MRGNAEAHELIAPGSLPDVLELLAAAPGQWTPIAGGTELMVAHAAGRLSASKLMSLWGIPELRFIEATSSAVVIGAGATFSRSARGRDDCDGVPAVGQGGELDWRDCEPEPRDNWRQPGERIAGSRFFAGAAGLRCGDGTGFGARQAAHSLCGVSHGYKKNAHWRQMNCFSRSICRGGLRSIGSTLRKVGTRRAMAIAKVALAGTALLRDGAVSEIRLAAASLAPFPARLHANRIGAAWRADFTDVGFKRRGKRCLPKRSRSTIFAPLPSIGRRVGANLLEEFLLGLSPKSCGNERRFLRNGIRRRRR